MFHYDFLKENDSSASTIEGNVEFLNQKRTSKAFKTCSINELKQAIIYNNIECRL